MSQQPQHLLEVRHLSKYYFENRMFKKKHLVLDNISFEVMPKEIFAITGNNSCGKSTIAGILSGAIKKDDGVISFMGTRLEYGDTNFRRTHIRIANLQQIATFNLHMEVYEFLGITLDIAEVDHEFHDEIIMAALAQVKAPVTLRHKSINRLNKQEQSLVALAHALIMQPEVIIIDDLFATLDLSFQGVLVNILLDLQQAGKTIILITSDLGIVKHLSDRVLILQDGVVEDYGSTYNVLTDSSSEFTKRLVKSYFGKSLNSGDWLFSFAH